MHLPSTLNKAFVLVAYLIVLQVSGQRHSAGINTNNPNPNAVLHLVSTNGNQGLLIPQIGTTQRLSMDYLTLKTMGCSSTTMMKENFTTRMAVTGIH